MALADLLYLCPFCGEDPLLEDGVRLRCPKCERTFEEVAGSAEIHVELPSGAAEACTPDSLSRRVEEFGRGMMRASRAGGGVRFESRASARVATQEDPIVRGKEVVGFVERRGAPSDGMLRLLIEELRFELDGGGRIAWPLLDIRAVQGSSSSLQISPVEGGVVTFRFVDASPRRWEELLKFSLREAWLRAGRGEIVEFQPRIHTG